MIIVFLAVALVGFGVASGWLLERLPTLGSRLLGVGILSIALPLATLLIGERYSHTRLSGDLVAAVAASSTSALIGSLLVRRSIMSGVRRLQLAAGRFARGDLGARASTRGPAELSDLADSFNRMADNVERLFEARRELVAWASHDLRTPLTSLQAMVESISDGVSQPSRYLPAMHEQLRRLGTLVDDLLELSLIDAGAVTLDLRRVMVHQVVYPPLRSVEAQARANGVRIDSRIDEALPAVRWAPDKIERVIGNLLANALEYTPTGGSITVSAEPVGDSVVVVVEDSGEGLPAAALDRLFERFWRGEPARSTGRASVGLGLAIARGLVQAHGGDIQARSSTSGGARFEITLPLDAGETS